MNLSNIITAATNAGVYLYCKDDQLKFKMSAKSFPVGLKHQIMQNKDDIIALLARQSNSQQTEQLPLHKHREHSTQIIRLIAGERNNKQQDGRVLDFSIMFFAADEAESQGKFDLMIKSAKHADANGFKAVWVPERHFNQFGGAFASPSIAASSLSTITKQIHLRAGSVVLPLNDPIRVAEEWSMIDNISNGRVGVALASGWHPNDFVFAGADFDNRHQQLKQKTEQLHALWEGEGVMRENGKGEPQRVKIRPLPVQAKLPTWVTAGGNPETFRYAGEIGANILTHMLGQSMAQLQSNLMVYFDSLKSHGYERNHVEVTLMMHSYLDNSLEKSMDIVEKPFKSYLCGFLNLLGPMAEEFGLDMDKQKDDLLTLAFERYSQSSALFGTPQSCQTILDEVEGLGVTEIACLIDFGVQTDAVLNSLNYITEAKALRMAVSPSKQRL